MRIYITAAAIFAVTALSGCGKNEECTSELAQKKAEELTRVVQEVITANPEKAQEVTAKVQEITARYANSDSSEACKVIDEFIASVKG